MVKFWPATEELELWVTCIVDPEMEHVKPAVLLSMLAWQVYIDTDICEGIFIVIRPRPA